MSVNPEKELIRALIAALGSFETIEHRISPWASVMFNGDRHIVTLKISTHPQLDERITGLCDADLPMRGHFVADLSVESVTINDDHCIIQLEALTIEEV